jgi:hypothetical protein
MGPRRTEPAASERVVELTYGGKPRMNDKEIRPGDVHVFESGQLSLALGIGVWAAKNRSRVIHIHLTGPKDFHTTVTNQPGSDRYHRTLFRNLRRVLQQHGRWPFGEQGAETEVRGPVVVNRSTHFEE